MAIHHQSKLTTVIQGFLIFVTAVVILAPIYWMGSDEFQVGDAA